MNNLRGGFSSRIGFIMAAAGSAVVTFVSMTACNFLFTLAELVSAF